jgi:hypothetical protein
MKKEERVMSTGKTGDKIAPRTSALVREMDPAIEPLRTADSYGFLTIMLVVLVAGIVGIYLWSDAMEPVPSDTHENRPAATDNATPTPQPPISPVESARVWRERYLAGTEFAALPVRSADEGCCLVYTVQRGDSLSGILARFRTSMPESSQTWTKVCATARDHHDLQYGHGLWPGDEVWLLMPDASAAPPKAPPELRTPPAEGAGTTPLQGI